MFTLKFKTGNAAFQDGDGIYETTRILANVAESVRNGQDCGKIRDINGNAIGEWYFNVEEEEL